MATSDSEDFESADEGFDGEDSPKKKQQPAPAKPPQTKPAPPVTVPEKSETPSPVTPVPEVEESAWEPDDLDVDLMDGIDDLDAVVDDVTLEQPVEEVPKPEPKPEKSPEPKKVEEVAPAEEVEKKSSVSPAVEEVKPERRPRPLREVKEVAKQPPSSTKKLGSKIASSGPKLECKEDSPEDEKPGSVDAEQKSTLDNVPSVLDKLSSAAETPAQSSGWGSWGGWGTSLLSTATSSVSSLGSHVISTVIDTVESGLGAPDPEDIAREQIASTVKEPPVEVPEEEKAENTTSEAEGGFPLGSLISGVSNLGKFVENTSSKVITGGLDTLENIGKKTMQVLQDGDPGLKKKRALFEADKPVLSHALREAKEMAEQEEKAAEEKLAARKVHFETLFDDFQGLAHLEALEMLSRQSEMKLQSTLLKLSGPELKSVNEKLAAIRDQSVLPSTDDMEEPEGDLMEETSQAFANLPVSCDKLEKIWTKLQEVPEKGKTLTEEHAVCISTLAEMTAACVEMFHRLGEMLMVDEGKDALQQAEVLQGITINFTFIVERTASILCERLNDSHGEDAQPIITKVFLEASNSSTYIQDAFQLLMPVLQQAEL